MTSQTKSFETKEESEQLNQMFFDKLRSRDSSHQKEAEDIATDYIRLRLRERGFTRNLYPVIPIQPNQLTRQSTSEDPIYVGDMEAGSPAAISVAFGLLPDNHFIAANRYEIGFSRLMTPRFTKDNIQLLTYIMDIRQVVSDNSLKDLMAEEDTQLIDAVDTCMLGPDQIMPTSGIAQWRTYPGVSRDALWDSRKILSQTPTQADAKKMLVNQTTIFDFCKPNTIEQGPNMAEDQMKNGWTQAKYLGLELMVTLKRTLVPDGSAYYWADPAFFGKFLELQETVMHVRSDAFLLEFFAYEVIGLGIANTNSFGRADFAV